MTMAMAHHVTTVMMVPHHVAAVMVMAHVMTAVAMHAVHADVDDVGGGIDGADHAGGGRGGGGDADGAERGQGCGGDKGLPHGGFLVGYWWPGPGRRPIRRHRGTAMLPRPFRGVRTSKPGMDKEMPFRGAASVGGTARPGVRMGTPWDPLWRWASDSIAGHPSSGPGARRSKLPRRRGEPRSWRPLDDVGHDNRVVEADAHYVRRGELMGDNMLTLCPPANQRLQALDEPLEVVTRYVGNGLFLRGGLELKPTSAFGLLS